MTDRIQKMAQEGLNMGQRFEGAISEVSGLPEVDADSLTDLYLAANFEQRYQMFLDVFSTHGHDGLQMLQQVYKQATEVILGDTR